ncbi:helix-turn-helix domain-containing protein [Streptomyces sp. NPDC094147]|uniref:helix-turn-helix domain-containing protein n=1 Tax=Streptomyces sp. NPDC094147 TaxID=3366057 RepID=UPI003814AAC5
MRLTSPFTIELTQAKREVLERLADSRTAPFGQVQRASVILALAEGMSNAATARAAGRHVDTVRSWRKRFTAERLAALVDRPRPLGRPRLSAEDKLQVIAAATAQPPTADTVWTHRLLSDHLRRSGPGGLRLPGRTDPGLRRPQAAPGARLADPTNRPGVLHPCR